MSYRDPYAKRFPDNAYYNQPQYATTGTDLDNYPSSQPPHQTYAQGMGGGYDNYDQGYRDNDDSDPYYGVPPQPPASKEHREESPATRAAPYNIESNELGGFSSAHGQPPHKSASAIRKYRQEHQGDLWTTGSRVRCFGRFFCCTIMISLFLVISILLALALWIRPPNINIDGVGPASAIGSLVQFQEDGVQINLGVNISVSNPNYFSVVFQEIKAEIFYPIGNTPIGGGSAKDVVFHSNAVTNWTFPFTIDYHLESDPGSRIISDLAQRCGLTGPKSNVNVNYKITLGLRILFITVSPVVSNQFSFECPLDPNALRQFLQGSGIDPSIISGLIGS